MLLHGRGGSIPAMNSGIVRQVFSTKGFASGKIVAATRPGRLILASKNGLKSRLATVAACHDRQPRGWPQAQEQAMTLKAYDPAQLDELALRLLDLAAIFREMSRRGREAGIEAMPLNDRKAQEWCQKLEHWALKAQSELHLEVLRGTGRTAGPSGHREIAAPMWGKGAGLPMSAAPKGGVGSLPRLPAMPPPVFSDQISRRIPQRPHPPPGPRWAGLRRPCALGKACPASPQKRSTTLQRRPASGCSRPAELDDEHHVLMKPDGLGPCPSTPAARNGGLAVPHGSRRGPNPMSVETLHTIIGCAFVFVWLVVGDITLSNPRRS